MQNLFLKGFLVFSLGLFFCIPSFAQNIIQKSQLTTETNSKGVKVYNVDRKVLKNGENVLKTESGTVTFTLKKGKVTNMKLTSPKGEVFVFEPSDRNNAFACGDNTCGCNGAKDCQNMIVFSGMKFTSCNCTTTYDENGEVTGKACICTMQ